jgi:hypothetical protein
MHRIQAFPAALEGALATIQGQGIRAHVRFLSHDLLEGRAPGTRGGQLVDLLASTRSGIRLPLPRCL